MFKGECGYGVAVRKIPKDNETTMMIKISLTISKPSQGKFEKSPTFDMIMMDNTNTELTRKKMTNDHANAMMIPHQRAAYRKLHDFINQA